MKDKFEFIDELLARFEDWMHGKDGEDVTTARYYLGDIRSHLAELNKTNDALQFTEGHYTDISDFVFSIYPHLNNDYYAYWLRPSKLGFTIAKVSLENQHQYQKLGNRIEFMNFQPNDNFPSLDVIKSFIDMDENGEVKIFETMFLTHKKDVISFFENN